MNPHSHHPSREGCAPLHDTLLSLAWAALLSFLLIACLPSPASAQDAANRPNILLIVTDDQGYGDASCNGPTDLQTPSIDAIAKNGARLARFRVNPLCAPTRSSILTGLYSLENGMWRGPGADSKGEEPADGWPADARRIPESIRLLPQYLKDAGYATGIFGKWHLGEDPANVPNARGFDEFLGFLAGAHPYWIRRNHRLMKDGEPFTGTGHTTDLFADAAVDFIRRHAGHPFFCYVPFNAVHGPLRSDDHPEDSSKPEWLAKYESLGVLHPRRDYNGVMSHADERIGSLLATLRELDLEARTLVICVGDNGALTDKYPGNNGPFRAGKGTTYEGGIRVPAVMQWPGVIPAGIVSSADAVHFDLFATILDAAGITPPDDNGGVKVSGVSLLPHLKSGGTSPLPERTLFWDLYGKQAALHGPWKIVAEMPNHHGKFDEALSAAETQQFELYNLADDPGESQDVAADHPDVYRHLKQQHLDWLRQFAKPVR
jgi:arylsulfatase A-like enzyme